MYPIRLNVDKLVKLPLHVYLRFQTRTNVKLKNGYETHHLVRFPKKGKCSLYESPADVEGKNYFCIFIRKNVLCFKFFLLY